MADGLLDDADVLGQIIALIKKLHPDARKRIYELFGTFFS